jgi:integrase
MVRPSKKFAVPGYCKHPTGQAYVRLNGQFKYLGKHGTPESKAEYARLIAEYAKPEARQFYDKNERADAISVNELCARYLLHAESYYGEDQLHIVHAVIRPLRTLYKELPAAEFGTKQLKAVRQHLIQQGDLRQKKSGEPVWKPLSRSYINRLVRYVRTVFKWGVSESLIDVAVWQTLLTVDAIKKGREKQVKETEKKKSIPSAAIAKTLEHLSATVSTMVKCQLLAACRPDEITIVRPCDIQATDNPNVWLYQPYQHKNSWRDDDDKPIYFGPAAMELLKPYIQECESEEDYLFSPQRVMKQWNESRRGQGTFVKRNYTPKENPIGTAKREHYTDDTYCRAVKRACAKAGVPVWTPNRLRHTRASELRDLFGLEAASFVLRHSDIETTQIYTERADKKHREVIAKVG